MKVGLVGIGYWGKNYIRICQKNNLEIKTVCDLNEERKDILPEKINFTTDYKNILNDTEIECVIICTPASTHHKLCKEFLNNSKHVLVEKPTCIKKEDCDELVKIAQTKNIVFMTDYTFLFNSRVRFLKDYLKENLKNPIQAKFIRKNYGPVRNDVNVLWDLLSHDISIFLYLFDIEDVDFLSKDCIKISHYSYEKNIDSCNVFLNYKNINLIFEVSWLDLEKERKIIFSDTTKKIIIDDVGVPVTILTRENDDIGEYFIGSYQQQFNRMEPSIKINEPLDTMIKEWKYFLTGNRDNLEKLNKISVNTTKIICYLNSLIENKFSITKSKIKDNIICENTKIIEPVNIYGAKIGKDCFIGPFTEIQKNCYVGDNSRISSHTFICSDVTIGRKCFIGHGVMFTNDKFDAPIENWISRKTIVGNNVRIGSNSTLLPVKIGDNVVIGAGSVITKDIPDNCIVCGNPAKIMNN